MVIRLIDRVRVLEINFIEDSQIIKISILLIFNKIYA